MKQFRYIRATQRIEFPGMIRLANADPCFWRVNDMGRFQTVLAARERRKARRYTVEVQGLIKVDDEVADRVCMIHDISQTGALIAVENGETLDDFTLTVSRRCRVVRRDKDGTRLGVEFLVPWSVTP